MVLKQAWSILSTLPGPTLDYVKIWQFWMVPQPAPAGAGLTFSNGYRSEGLAQMLELIMQHQDNFVPSMGPGAGMIQVTRPSEERKEAASICMKQAYSHERLEFEHTPSAATA